MNIYEGERGDWIVNVYTLKIENGMRAIDTSTSDYFKLEDKHVAEIQEVFENRKQIIGDKKDENGANGFSLKKLDEPRGALTQNGFNLCKGTDFFEIDSMEDFKALCVDESAFYGGSLGQFVRLKPDHPANPTNEIITVVPSIAAAVNAANSRFAINSSYAEEKEYFAAFSNYTETIRTPIENYCIALIVDDRETGKKLLNFGFGDSMVIDYVSANMDKFSSISGLSKTDNPMILEMLESKPDILRITDEISSVMSGCSNDKPKLMSRRDFESVFTTYIHGVPVHTPLPFLFENENKLFNIASSMDDDQAMQIKR